MQEYDLDYFTKIHNKIRDNSIAERQKIFEEQFLPSLEADEDREFFIKLKKEIGGFFQTNSLLSSTRVLSEHKMASEAELSVFYSLAENFQSNCGRHARFLCAFLNSKVIKSIVVTSSVDHAFNLVEYKGNVYCIDPWYGQLISKFDYSFIENGSIYAFFNIKARYDFAALDSTYQCNHVLIDNAIKKFDELVVKNINFISSRVTKEAKGRTRDIPCYIPCYYSVNAVRNLIKCCQEYINKEEQQKQSNNESSAAEPTNNISITREKIEQLQPTSAKNPN